jgi:pectinesterase
MSALYEKRRHLFVLLTLTLAAATSAASDVSFYPSAETAAAAHCDGTLYPELRGIYRYLCGLSLSPMI